MPQIVYCGPGSVLLHPFGEFRCGVPRHVDEAEMVEVLGHPVGGSFPRNASFALVVPVPELEEPTHDIDALLAAIAAAPATLPSREEEADPNTTALQAQEEDDQ